MKTLHKISLLLFLLTSASFLNSSSSENDDDYIAPNPLTQNRRFPVYFPNPRLIHNYASSASTNNTDKKRIKINPEMMVLEFDDEANFAALHFAETIFNQSFQTLTGKKNKIRDLKKIGSYFLHQDAAFRTPHEIKQERKIDEPYDDDCEEELLSFSKKPTDPNSLYQD